MLLKCCTYVAVHVLATVCFLQEKPASALKTCRTFRSCYGCYLLLWHNDPHHQYILRVLYILFLLHFAEGSFRMPELKRPHDDVGSTALVEAKRPRNELVQSHTTGGSTALQASGPPRTSNMEAPIMLLKGHEGEVYTAKFHPEGQVRTYSNIRSASRVIL